MQTHLSTLLQRKGHTIHHVEPHVSVHEAAIKMTQLNVGALLVMESETLRGIVSERDILRKLVGCGCDPAKVKVAEIMTDKLVTVSPKTTVSEAMKLMTEHRFRHLPVIDEGKLVGLISIGDLTKWVISNQAHEIDSLTQYIHQ